MTAPHDPTAGETDAQRRERFERAAIEIALARRAEAQMVEATALPNPWQREALAAGLERPRLGGTWRVTPR